MFFYFFDLDGTLIKPVKISSSKNRFATPIKKVFRINVQFRRNEHRGKTDRKIVFDLLRDSGIPEDRISKGLDRIASLMAEGLNTDSNSSRLFETIPQAVKLLQAKYKNFLVTGNFQKVAEWKLQHSGLEGYFQKGFFGDKCLGKIEILKKAVEFVEKNYKVRLNKENACMIGDTEQDLEAGEGCGIHTVRISI